MAFLVYRTVVFGNDAEGWTAYPQSGRLSSDTTVPASWQTKFGVSDIEYFFGETKTEALEKCENFLKEVTKPVPKKPEDETDYIMFRNPW